MGRKTLKRIKKYKTRKALLFQVGDEVKLSKAELKLMDGRYGNEGEKLRGFIQKCDKNVECQYTVFWRYDTVGKYAFGSYWNEAEIELSEGDWRNKVVVLRLV